MKKILKKSAVILGFILGLGGGMGTIYYMINSFTSFAGEGITFVAYLLLGILLSVFIGGALVTYGTN